MPRWHVPASHFEDGMALEVAQATEGARVALHTAVCCTRVRLPATVVLTGTEWAARARVSFFAFSVRCHLCCPST